MVPNDNQTYYGDYFSLSTNMESLCCTLEANIIICQLYFNKEKKKKERGHRSQATLKPSRADYIQF